MQQRGLEWHDFTNLIDRNKTSDAIITFYRDDDINPNQVTIFDRNLPRRSGIDHEMLMGYGEEDHWRLSQVTSCSNFNGYIPMASSKGVYDERHGKFIESDYRGALDTLQNLRNEGCVRRTDELVRLFEAHGRFLK